MDEPLIRPHGGYRGLKAFQMSEIVYDATVAFCNRLIPRTSRTHDQMVQTARSGRQNIAEGSQASATSSKIELKLVSIARASQEELLLDYEDYLRQNQLALWPKTHEKAEYIRALAHRDDRSYATYQPYIETKSPEIAANTAICLVRQTSYLLDQLLRQLEKQFVEEGGFTERLYRVRSQARR